MGLSSNPCRLRFLISIAVRRERVTKKMKKALSRSKILPDRAFLCETGGVQEAGQLLRPADE